MVPGDRYWQSAALSIEVVANAGKNDCIACCSFFCWFGMMISGERDREDHTLLRDDLIDGNQFELMWLTLPPLDQAYAVGYLS